MKTDTIQIIDIGRGPQLSTSRVTVQDLVPYFREGCSLEAIDRVRRGVQHTLELIDRAKQKYRDELAQKLESKYTGDIVAIELGTNNYFVGEDEVEAADKARAAGHEGTLFFLRVGSPYAHRLMTPRQ